MKLRVWIGLAVLGWFAGPASAVTVFSNIGPPPAGVIQLAYGVDDAVWTGTRVTTDNQWWKLTSVTVPIFNATNAGTPFPAQALNQRVHIFSDSANLPGTNLRTINGNAAVPDGSTANVVFTPGGPDFVFQPNTTYWVAVSQVEDTNPSPGSAVLSDNVAPTGVWSSPNNVAQSANAGSTWQVSFSDRHQFEIEAMLVPEPGTAAALLAGGLIVGAGRGRRCR